MTNPFAHLLPKRPAAPPPVDDAEPPSALWDIMRSAGTGLRSGVEGLAGMAGDLRDLPAVVSTKALKGLGYTDEETGGAVDTISGVLKGAMPLTASAPTTADVRGVTEQVIGEGYEPKTTPGKYAKTVASFLPGSVGGPGGIARNLLLGGVIPGVASEAAGQAYEGTEDEGTARTIAALASGVGGGMLFGPRTRPNAAAPVRDATPQDQRAAIVDAAARQSTERRQRPNPVQGMPPIDEAVPGGRPLHMPRAAMPDSTTAGYLAGKAGQVPVIGSPLARSAERTVEDLGTRLDQVAQGQGAVNKSGVAHQTRDMLLDWQDNVAPAQMGAAYDEVDNIIAAANRTPTGRPRPQPRTPLANTAQAVRDILANAHESTVTSHQPAIDLVMEAVQRPGGLTYTGIKRLRTDIGARGPKGNILPQPGTSMEAMDTLYGALSEDLRMAALNAGGARAMRAWENANGIARVIKTRQAEIERVLGKKGMNSPENIANRLLNLAGTRGAGNLQMLQNVRRAIVEAGGPQAGAQAWNDVGASLIHRLGRDPSSATEAFSPDRFLTAMGKFEPEAARVLFGRHTMDQLNDLRLLSETHRNLMRRGNPSGTGGVVALGQMATAVSAAGAGAIATGSAAPLALLAGVTGGGMALSSLLARPAARQKVIDWTRARNQALQYGSVAAMNAYITASNDLAPFVAAESGRQPRSVARELGGFRAPEPGENPFKHLIPQR